MAGCLMLQAPLHLPQGEAGDNLALRPLDCEIDETWSCSQLQPPTRASRRTSWRNISMSREGAW